jgi:hypothetical protein
MSAAALPRVEIVPRKGFTPFLNEYCLEWPRLLSGNAQIFSAMYINTEIHAPRDKGAPVPYWSRPISDEELATVCRCTVRAVEIAIKDLVDRNVIEKKRAGRAWAYHIPFDKWHSLPDIPPLKPLVVVGNSDPKPADEEDSTETKKPRGVIEAVYEAPQMVNPGKRTRKKELPRPASWIQMEVDGDVRQEVYPYLCDGVIVVRVKGEREANKASTKGEEKRKTLRAGGTQVPEESTKQDFSTLHSMLDDYCRRHHGTIPNDKLLAKVVAALGSATLKDFENVFRARIRSGPPVPVPVFINLAEDAAREVATRKPAPPKAKELAPDDYWSDEQLKQVLTELEHDPSDKLSLAILADLSPARVERVKARSSGSG